MEKLLKYKTVILTDNKLCYSVYKPEFKILHSTYKGVPNEKLFLQHLENILQFSESNQILGVLVDLRKLVGSYIKYFDYLENQKYPNLQHQGFSHEAFVISDDIIVANVTNKLIEVLARLNITAKIFSDLDKARDWLNKNV